MNRATKFRSFSPLSWPAKRTVKKFFSSLGPKGHKSAPKEPFEMDFPYDDFAYESDMEIRLSNSLIA